jgi:hypothetical protein
MVSRVTLLALLPLLVLGCMAALARYVWATFTNPRRAIQIALMVDDLGNVAGNGALGQTISYRAACSVKPWGRLLCAALDAVDPGHCARALISPEQDLHP